MIPITAAIMDVFGGLKTSLSPAGKTVDDMDLLIAATALTHNLTLTDLGTVRSTGIIPPESIAFNLIRLSS